MAKVTITDPMEPRITIKKGTVVRTNATSDLGIVVGYNKKTDCCTVASLYTGDTYKFSVLNLFPVKGKVELTNEVEENE